MTPKEKPGLWPEEFLESCFAATRGESPTKPEWIRIKAAVQTFGIGRTRLYELINDGQIKSALIKKHGQVRGTRLINYESISNYIHTVAAG